MSHFPPIADHGLIGDLQTAALVSTNGEIDWYCCPRFDSPSVFASLLDRDRGGYFRIAPANDNYVAKQLYLPDTAILLTRFMSADGVGEVIDFMPISNPNRVSANHQLVRVVRVVRGHMRFVFDCQPRFDFDRLSHDVELGATGAVFRSGELSLTLHTGLPLNRHGGGVRCECDMDVGEPRGMILESASGGRPRPLDPRYVAESLETTGAFWRSWVNKSSYRGRWREQVSRSAITLKLMTYAPTGGLVAAPTAGLPEQLGGERNWDYRYTWIRDASLSVRALLGLGYMEEAQTFASWVADRVRSGQDGPVPLKIMYRVDGSSDLVEEELDHLAGYRDSRPVRLGNGAAHQLQLDIYGEVLDCLALADRAGGALTNADWSGITGIADWLADHWDQPDEGIWETRGGAQDHTYSRLMCWVAFDRAIRIAVRHGWPGDVTRWTRERDAVYHQIMDRGWSPDRCAFVQHYNTTVLDASLLLMPSSGFISPHDPSWLSTLDAIGAELVSDSLVYRYDPSASPDGLRGSEGTFSICTFWYVDALTRSGRLEQARLIFEKMFTYANHLGLYGEEVGLTGEQLGNFPQAFSHLALINAALGLDARLGDQPWTTLSVDERARLLDLG
ncbi:GH15 family glucan-1,4-alpha-glucosidase [Antricoccus suffuscus]|uniref:GH15 family glucan-1,4-alpha-glucosidase n=1 Tax=Antricoccus suffuscus TaxID=1629062 RepID=A0A2T1A0Z1_9ACTN|nr:glycoside hydrolase family 15 protein [Antricoccus suffuscus]PRZ41998.1 GH15 family glucan-1,4-alpha-glucosidase [Antricoccus suffuscus]